MASKHVDKYTSMFASTHQWLFVLGFCKSSFQPPCHYLQVTMSSADSLIAALEGVDATSFSSEAERVRAMDAISKALSRVQKPWDTVWQHNWVNPATNACVKTLIDAGVFNKWIESGASSKTCAELAELTGADEVLLSTLLCA